MRNRLYGYLHITLTMMLLVNNGYTQNMNDAFSDHVLKIHSAEGSSFNYTANEKGEVKITLFETKKNEFEGMVYWDNVNLFGKASLLGKVVSESYGVSKIVFEGIFDVSGVGGWSDGTTAPLTIVLYYDQKGKSAQGKYTIHKEGKLPKQDGRIKFDKFFIEEKKEVKTPHSKSSLFLSHPIGRSKMEFPENLPFLNNWFVAEERIYELLPAEIEAFDGVKSIDKNSTQVIVSPLSFFGNEVILVRLTDSNWSRENLAFYFLLDVKSYLKKKENYLRRLDGSEELNELSNPITDVTYEYFNLNDDNVLEFTHFMCFFNRSTLKNGQTFFLINDPLVLLDKMDKKKFKEIKREVIPTQIDNSDGSSYSINSTILFNDKLYFANFSIMKSSGFICMKYEEVIAQGVGEFPLIPID